MKLLSIIVPVYNRPRQLAVCLDSIAHQCYRPLQVVVVDNASSDNTPEVAERCITQLHGCGIEAELIHEPRPGVTFARNTAIEHTNGSVIAFVDSDDTIRPYYARTLMAHFNNDDKVEIAFWRKSGHWPDGTSRCFRFARKASLQSHIVHAVLDTMGCAVSRNLLLRTGGWNNSLSIWNDWEIGIRYLLNLKGSVARINSILVDKYQHDNSITGSCFLSRKGQYEVSLKAALEYAGQNPWLQTLLAYKTAVLAANYTHEGDSDAGHETLRMALEMLPSQNAASVIRLVYKFTAGGLRGAAIWAMPLLKLLTDKTPSHKI